MTRDVVNRGLRTETASDLHGLAGNVLKDVAGKILERILRALVENCGLAFELRKNLVIYFSVLNLLNQADWLTIHNLSGQQPLASQDEAIHVVAIFSGSIENETIRPRKRARYHGGSFQPKRLLIVLMLHARPGLVFDKHLHSLLSWLSVTLWQPQHKMSNDIALNF